MNNKALKIVIYLLGFIIATGIAALIEIGLLLLLNEMFDARLSPRGLGWILLPIIVGLGAGNWLSSQNMKFVHQIVKIKHFRIILVSLFSWWLLASSYVLIFEPYGSTMYGDDWINFYELLFIPPILIAVIFFAFRWALKSSNEKSVNKNAD